MAGSPEVACLGEALVDLVSLNSGVGIKDASGFLKAPGGAPLNVSIMLTRMNHSARFIGKVGSDPFGNFLEETLKHHGVDTFYVFFTEEARTGLAFVSLTSTGERDFVFYRNPAADMLLDEIEVDHHCLEGCRVFHFGSVSLSANPSRTATMRCLRDARSLGLTVSFDPNLRLCLWTSEAEARRWCMKAITEVDVLKLSGEEALFLSGEDDALSAASWLVGQGPHLVVVTLGEEGSAFVTSDASGFVPTYRVETVDTTGAGDAFMGALLARILEYGDPHHATEADLREMMAFANAAGALATTRRGAVSSLPTRQQVVEISALT